MINNVLSVFYLYLQIRNHCFVFPPIQILLDHWPGALVEGQNIVVVELL